MKFRQVFVQLKSMVFSKSQHYSRYCCFWKKTQLSGIMVNEKFSKIFKKPIRLEVTWDADLIDMVRCKFVIKALIKNNILENVQERSGQLKEGLLKIRGIKNLRNAGLLLAFDLENKNLRDKLVNSLFEKNMIVNPTKDNTIRLRPPLKLGSLEIDEAINKIKNPQWTVFKRQLYER